MIIDYNYKPNFNQIGNTASTFTVTAGKKNRGFIYSAGSDDIGPVYPFVNFFNASGSLIGLTLTSPSGSFNDLYLSQFKIDDNSNMRATDINFPYGANSASSELLSLFYPIKYHSMIFNVDVSGTGEWTTKPLIVELY
jgi:hypothetical protein